MDDTRGKGQRGKRGAAAEAEISGSSDMAPGSSLTLAPSCSSNTKSGYQNGNYACGGYDNSNGKVKPPNGITLAATKMDEERIREFALRKQNGKKSSRRGKRGKQQNVDLLTWLEQRSLLGLAPPSKLTKEEMASQFQILDTLSEVMKQKLDVKVVDTVEANLGVWIVSKDKSKDIQMLNVTGIGNTEIEARADAVSQLYAFGNGAMSGLDKKKG